MKQITSPARIQKGKLILYYEDYFKGRIAKTDDCECEVIIRTQSNNISNQQRRYFFGVIAEIMLISFNHLGTKCDLDDIVTFIKEKWLYREEINPITGRVIKSHISLSDSSKGLSKEEFQIAKEAIQQFAIENLNTEIPDPDPNWRMYREPKNPKS